MMQIRVVNMGVAHGRVPMRMRMRFGSRLFMRVLVMRIVNVAVLMLYGFMVVFVRMTFSQMQPQTNSHENTGNQKPCRQRLPKQRDGQECADEGRQRIVGAGPSRPKVSQGKYKHHQTDAYAKKADEGRGAESGSMGESRA